MKYSINQFVKMIKSPVLCSLNGEKIMFDNGTKLAAHQFEKQYEVTSISIENEQIVLELKEQLTPLINWAGEEAIHW